MTVDFAVIKDEKRVWRTQNIAWELFAARQLAGLAMQEGRTSAEK